MSMDSENQNRLVNRGIWLAIAIIVYCHIFARSAYTAEYDQNSIDNNGKLFPVPAKVGRTKFMSVTLEQVQNWDKEWRKGVKEVPGWRCSTVSDCLYAYSKAVRPDAAIGVVWLIMDSGGGHALCAFMDGKSVLYYCPSTRKAISLSPAEFKSIYFVLF